MSIKSLLNVALLMLLIFFIFAVLGVNLFQDLTTTENNYKFLWMDRQDYNFGSFHNSLMVIFIISTGEGWSQLMYDVGQKYTCNPYSCESPVSVAFFFVFVLVVQNIMLNLFILVIIQQF
jgi:hypothetical protein